MRASVMPGATAMPWRTISSLMTPPTGVATVCSASGWPEASTRSTSAAGMPSSSSRCFAACASAASPVALTARYSCCAPSHSGLKSSASGAPAATTSPGARPNTRSTKPAVRACTMAMSRSFSCTVPTASTAAPSLRFSTTARRSPSACCACVEMASVPDAPVDASPSSA